MTTILASPNHEVAVHHREIQGLQVDRGLITHPDRIANANTPQNLVDHLLEDLRFLPCDLHVYLHQDIVLNLTWVSILATNRLSDSPNVEERGVHLLETGVIESLVTEEDSAGQGVGTGTISEIPVLQVDEPFRLVELLHALDQYPEDQLLTLISTSLRDVGQLHRQGEDKDDLQHLDEVLHLHFADDRERLKIEGFLHDPSLLNLVTPRRILPKGLAAEKLHLTLRETGGKPIPEHLR